MARFGGKISETEAMDHILTQIERLKVVLTRGSALSDEQIEPPLVLEQVHGLGKVRPLQADPVAVQHLVARLDS